MLAENQKRKIERATVKLAGAQGVLIPGGLIMTAAHCVPYANDGGN